MTVRPISPLEFQQRCPELVDVYIAAMAYDPAVRQPRIHAWSMAPLRPGFQAVGVFISDETTVTRPTGTSPSALVSTSASASASTTADRCVGICYGARASSHDWWFQHVYRGMEIHRRYLLHDYFEVAEVHILPEYQGKGLGKTMLTTLLTLSTGERALLSTPEVAHENNGAFGLYRKMGFYDVLRDFYFPGDDRPFAILGLDLPLSSS